LRHAFGNVCCMTLCDVICIGQRVAVPRLSDACFHVRRLDTHRLSSRLGLTYYAGTECSSFVGPYSCMSFVAQDLVVVRSCAAVHDHAVIARCHAMRSTHVCLGHPRVRVSKRMLLLTTVTSRFGLLYMATVARCMRACDVCLPHSTPQTLYMATVARCMRACVRRVFATQHTPYIVHGHCCKVHACVRRVFATQDTPCMRIMALCSLMNGLFDIAACSHQRMAPILQSATIAPITLHHHCRDAVHAHPAGASS
jgi:hypothetical protein